MLKGKVALVTGGNRGIGLQTCKELGRLGATVVLSSRDLAKGKAQAEQLKKESLDVCSHPLDMDDLKSIEIMAKWLESEFGKIDILINNAAILLDWGKKPDKKILAQTFETNVIGPYLLIEKVGEMMRAQNWGRIVNVSSEAGQLAHMGSLYPAYSISKAALNAVTKIFASEFSSYNILVNSVCPGWVKTDMGGQNAPRSVEKGSETIVWAATLPDNGPRGGFFQDKHQLAW